MKKDCLFINAFTKDFLLEVYYRAENDSPDYSVEYSEEVEMTTSELAEQFVTSETEDRENAIKVFVDKSARDFLIAIHEHFEENDDMLFVSLELTEAMEQFLYSLGKYLVRGDYNEPFAVD